MKNAIAYALTITLMFVFGIGFYVLSNTASATPAERSESPLEAVESEFGIMGVKPLGVRLTAAGYMLDFRFRVLDADAAKPVLDRRVPAELIVQRSGATLRVPRPPTTGRLRASAKYPKPNRNYFMLFANPGRHVQSGDKVTVVIGDFAAPNIVVQ